MPLDPKMRDYIETLKTTTASIGEHIEFTRIYQELASTEPRWQDLRSALPVTRIPPGMTLDAEVGTISVYADPIFEKIFTNLLDNTLRHGNHATTIRVFTQKSPDGLTIVWEDDGDGIPAPEKEKIFRQGYGKNTGLGLFLSREILSMTGISISETGVPGQGARFEMQVPKNGYRLTGSKERVSPGLGAASRHCDDQVMVRPDFCDRFDQEPGILDHPPGFGFGEPLCERRAHGCRLISPVEVYKPSRRAEHPLCVPQDLDRIGKIVEIDPDKRQYPHTLRTRRSPRPVSSRQTTRPALRPLPAHRAGRLPRHRYRTRTPFLSGRQSVRPGGRRTPRRTPGRRTPFPARGRSRRGSPPGFCHFLRRGSSALCRFIG